MINNRSVPPGTVVPVLAYPDVTEAIDWLCRSFGFRLRLRIGSHRAQLVLGDGAVIVTRGSGVTRDVGQGTHAVHVRVEDAAGHQDRAVAAGATLVNALADYPFGERQYTVDDPAGHRWTFSESTADVDPASWGATDITLG